MLKKQKDCFGAISYKTTRNCVGKNIIEKEIEVVLNKLPMRQFSEVTNLAY